MSSDHVNTGSIRESFFVNQLQPLHRVDLSEKAELIVEEKYTIELGGKGKSRSQIAGMKDAYIVADVTDTGFENHGYGPRGKPRPLIPPQSSGVFYPPIRGIVRRSNFSSLRSKNLSLTNKIPPWQFGMLY